MEVGTCQPKYAQMFDGVAVECASPKMRNFYCFVPGDLFMFEASPWGSCAGDQVVTNLECLRHEVRHIVPASPPPAPAATATAPSPKLGGAVIGCV